MKKVLFTAVLLTAFSGFANVKNTAKNVAAMQNTSVLAIKTATQKDLEKKDAWFCYKASETSSYNPISKETTITTTYICTWYDLSAAISQG
jgi:hypothetical protein